MCKDTIYTMCKEKKGQNNEERDNPRPNVFLLQVVEKSFPQGGFGLGFQNDFWLYMLMFFSDLLRF